MAARSRYLPDTRSHDKKDDFTPSRSNPRAIHGPWKSFRRRRVLFIIFALCLLYLFFKYMPTDVPPVSQRFDRRYGRLHQGLPSQHPEESQGPGTDGKEYNYDGPIAFYDLAKTLRGAATARDSRDSVLFAISSLASIQHIIPVACSMAQQNRSRVHVAFMGRQYANWNQIQAINGISGNDCPVFLHNARPDFPAHSSDNRLAISARASVGHIHTTIRLRAVLVGDTDYEDEYFVGALKEKTTSIGLSLITLPADGLGSLAWISSLDAASLNYFDKVHVDIVVQAQPESSASLIRLLRSMKDADYSGFALPRLTIELPAKVDAFLIEYLANFKWPVDGPGSESRLVIRHRIDATTISPVQASMWTVESFYPLVASESHVLLLSPGVELSTGYFQLMMYTLLEYRYAARHSGLVDRMIGLSLDLPALAPDLKTKSPWSGGHLAEPLVLWQAPNSNAAVFFGDRWMELHSFLSRRLMVDSALTRKTATSPSISHEYPAWLQPVLEMMQALDYYMLYPTFAAKENSAVVTVHRELHQSPEEYVKAKPDDEQPLNALTELAEGQALTAEDEIKWLLRQEYRVYTDSLATQLVECVAAAQRKSNVADDITIPLISFSGEKITREDSRIVSSKFAEDFAQVIGGCVSHDPTKKGNRNVGSLFCLPTAD